MHRIRGRSRGSGSRRDGGRGSVGRTKRERDGFAAGGMAGRRFRARRPCRARWLINNTISPFLRAFRSFSLRPAGEGEPDCLASLINIT